MNETWVPNAMWSLSHSINSPTTRRGLGSPELRRFYIFFEVYKLIIMIIITYSLHNIMNLELYGNSIYLSLDENVRKTLKMKKNLFMFNLRGMKIIEKFYENVFLYFQLYSLLRSLRGNTSMINIVEEKLSYVLYKRTFSNI